MLVTLQNSFHRTEISIRCTDSQIQEQPFGSRDTVLSLTESQARRAHRELCPSPRSCSCHGISFTIAILPDGRKLNVTTDNYANLQDF